MLHENDAVKIIESFLLPRLKLLKSQIEKDEIHRLADELRKAAGNSLCYVFLLSVIFTFNTGIHKLRVN